MITSTVQKGVAIIEMPDYRALSTHDFAVGRALIDAICAHADDDAVRVIVLAASGPDFCPDERFGNSTADTLASLSADQMWSDFYGVFQGASGLYQTVCYCKKVVVIAVQGQCSGAGSALLLCADLAVISENAKITSPFGTIPEASFVLAALTMRLNRAKAWVLTEEPLSAADALAFGLVNRVVKREDLHTEAIKLARTAARMPSDAMSLSKVMVESYLDSQAVGKEFDHAAFYATGMRALHASQESKP